MPHLTIPIDPVRGPLVSLLVGVSVPRANALTAAGLSVPTPVVVPFLVDTGASCSMVDREAIASLNLQPTGSTLISTPTTGLSPQSMLTFDVGIMLYHTDNSRIFASHPVIASDFGAQSIGGLLGRDVLQSCLLVYDGSSQRFSLAF